MTATVPLVPTSPLWTARAREPEWPAWLTSFRPHQIAATQQIVDEYEHGADVVFLDAPTGTGKTIIAEMVRRMVGKRGLYVCSTKTLQDQFVRDFDYSRVLKGRSNYPTQHYADKTAENCGGKNCGLCDGPDTCPYKVAKKAALTAPVAVLNTPYWLAEANNQFGMFGQRKFAVVDEADLIESSLMGWVQFRIGSRTVKDLGVGELKKGARVRTVATWLERVSEAAFELGATLERQMDLLDSVGGGAGADARVEMERMVRLAVKAASVGKELAGSGEWGTWVREYEDGAALWLKPVHVEQSAPDYFWPLAERWLLMSGSFVSVDEQAMSLGLDKAGLSWAKVAVPMMFEAHKRPIVLKPVAEVTRKGGEDAERKVAGAIGSVLGKGKGFTAQKPLTETVDAGTVHEPRRVLVHAVSFFLTKRIVETLTGRQVDRLTRETSRKVRIGDDTWEVHWYTRAEDRNTTLAKFTRDGPGKRVLVAASMDRGVDLPGDLCDTQIVAKVPYPSLGDRQVSERIRQPGGRIWYQCQVARTLLQMTGRGVRSVDDECVTWILDAQFTKWWTDGGRTLMPRWWREAIV